MTNDKETKELLSGLHRINRGGSGGSGDYDNEINDLQSQIDDKQDELTVEQLAVVNAEPFTQEDKGLLDSAVQPEDLESIQDEIDEKLDKPADDGKIRVAKGDELVEISSFSKVYYVNPASTAIIETGSEMFPYKSWTNLILAKGSEQQVLVYLKNTDNTDIILIDKVGWTVSSLLATKNAARTNVRSATIDGASTSCYLIGIVVNNNYADYSTVGNNYMRYCTVKGTTQIQSTGYSCIELSSFLDGVSTAVGTTDIISCSFEQNAILSVLSGTAILSSCRSVHLQRNGGVVMVLGDTFFTPAQGGTYAIISAASAGALFIESGSAVLPTGLLAPIAIANSVSFVYALGKLIYNEQTSLVDNNAIEMLNFLSAKQISDAQSFGFIIPDSVRQSDINKAFDEALDALKTQIETDAASNTTLLETLRNDVDINAAKILQLSGTGGALPAHDFGTLNPTSEELTEHAMKSIWGDGGIFTWDAGDNAASTYEIDSITYTAADIFNSTWVRNKYLGSNHRFLLTNTRDTNPAVFAWVDVGADTVSIATEALAGIVKASIEEGKINVNTGGEMSVVGWDKAVLTDKNVSFTAIPEDETPLMDAVSDTYSNVFSLMLAKTRGLFKTIARAVFTSGNQLINGEKTFSSEPVVPAKSTAAGNNSTKVATEKQVHDGLELKVGKTGDPDKVYGTNNAGDQTTFDKDEFGKVDTVDGIAPDAQKNVQIHKHITEAEAQHLIDHPEDMEPGVIYITTDGEKYLLDVAPDYVNQEATNRISVNGGEWTADRDGFVNCTLALNVNNAGAMTVLINNVQASGVSIIAVNPAYSHSFRDTVKVFKGDVVKLQSGNAGTYSCYFVPPRYKAVQPQKYIIDIQGDYSTGEKPVMMMEADGTLRQKQWIDGKPIWQLTSVTEASNIAAGTQQTTYLINGVNCVIDVKGYVMAENNTYSLNHVSTASGDQYRVSTEIGKNLTGVFLNIRNNGVNPHSYTAHSVIQYTKI